MSEGAVQSENTAVRQARSLHPWFHVLIVILILLTCAALAVLAAQQPLKGGRLVRGQNDFLAQFTGAILAFTPHLYSPEAVQQVMVEDTGVYLTGQSYLRLPFYYAVLLRPLTSLPCQTAYVAFQCLCLVPLALFVRFYPILMTVSCAVARHDRSLRQPTERQAPALAKRGGDQVTVTAGAKG